MKVGEDIFKKFGRTYEPEDMLVCEYEKGNEAFYILSGRVRITKFAEDREKTIDILKQGDFLGEMAILEQAPRSASAFAMEKTKVLVFNRENFEILLSSQPQMALGLLKVFIKRIRDAKRQLRILLLPDEESKLADAIVVLAEREGVEPAPGEQFKFSMKIEDLATFSDIPVEKAAEIIEKWEKEGKLRRRDDEFHIFNLGEFAGMVTHAIRRAHIEGSSE